MAKFPVLVPAFRFPPGPRSQLEMKHLCRAVERLRRGNSFALKCDGFFCLKPVRGLREYRPLEAPEKHLALPHARSRTGLRNPHASRRDNF